jgi:hypothetical protein
VGEVLAVGYRGPVGIAVIVSVDAGISVGGREDILSGVNISAREEIPHPTNNSINSNPNMHARKKLLRIIIISSHHIITKTSHDQISDAWIRFIIYGMVVFI